MLNIFSMYQGTEAIIAFLAFFIAIVVSLSFHEFAHAYTAHIQGDLTAKSYGRLTLNPIAHIDPIGMLMLLFVGFGWAKPVPVNPLKFKHYRRGFLIVSIAGVVVNFLFFLLFTVLNILVVLGKIPLDTNTSIGLFAYFLFNFMLTINLSLAIFNLFPIAPLDGFNVLTVLFKHDNALLKFLREYGQWILLVLLVSGLLEKVIFFLYDLIAKPITIFFTQLLF